MMSMLSVFATVAVAAGVSDGNTVKFHYSLTVDGEMIDSSSGKEPLEYVHGKKMIIPGLESALDGLNVGDKKSVTIAAEDGYGAVDPNAVVEVPKDGFANSAEAQEGMVVQVPTPDGKTMTGTVQQIKDEILILNFNHPLAGKALNFEIEIIEIL